MSPAYSVAYRRVVRHLLNNGGVPQAIQTGLASRVFYFNENLVLVSKEELKLAVNDVLPLPESSIADYGDYGFSFQTINDLVQSLSLEEVVKFSSNLIEIAPKLLVRYGGIASELFTLESKGPASRGFFAAPFINRLTTLKRCLNVHRLSPIHSSLEEENCTNEDLRRYLSMSITTLYNSAEITVDQWAQLIIQNGKGSSSRQLEIIFNPRLLDINGLENQTDSEDTYYELFGHFTRAHVSGRWTNRPSFSYSQIFKDVI